MSAFICERSATFARSRTPHVRGSELECVRALLSGRRWRLGAAGARRPPSHADELFETSVNIAWLDGLAGRQAREVRLRYRGHGNRKNMEATMIFVSNATFYVMTKR